MAGLQGEAWPSMGMGERALYVQCVVTSEYIFGAHTQLFFAARHMSAYVTYYYHYSLLCLSLGMHRPDKGMCRD